MPRPDEMKRIAAPMVGEMVSSTILTLAVIPAFYSLWKERDVRRADQADESLTLTEQPALAR